LDERFLRPLVIKISGGEKGVWYADGKAEG
jgi:hypothetical protein